MKKITKERIFWFFHLFWYYRFLSDENYIRLWYWAKYNKKINLVNPKKLTEKLQWIKLNIHNDEQTNLVDKAECKSIIGNLIGSQYIIPTVAIYDNVDDINWNELPEQYVIKCTHDSGNVFFCKDRDEFNRERVSNKLKKALKYNYYYQWREYPYKNIKPRVIVETYLGANEENSITDYKFYCFSGKPVYFMMGIDEIGYKSHVHDRQHLRFDMDCNSIEQYFSKEPCIDPKSVKISERFSEMVSIVNVLCKDYPFVRVDLLEQGGKVYFNELTFFSGGGQINMVSNEYSNYLASLINIPES